MPAPVLLAVDADPAALGDVERELRDRYASSYRVVCTHSPDEALATPHAARGCRGRGRLGARRRSGSPERPAASCSSACGSSTRTPSAACWSPWGAWADRPTAEAIFDSMALGRIDYYVLRPAASPDELFHQAISSFLLEWTKARRIAPHTVHIVGEDWSGRAYELRESFSAARCRTPSTWPTRARAASCSPRRVRRRSFR